MGQGPGGSVVGASVVGSPLVLVVLEVVGASVVASLVGSPRRWSSPARSRWWAAALR
ncbi:hypothetical protein [Nannocystis pusilla]|uniref:hypothetical protein n=1 Tax=Nannocystis pusilla TaxID=889268 RepID=UPI003B7614E4